MARSPPNPFGDPGAGAGAWAGAGACTSAGADGAQVAESSLEKDFGFAGGKCLKEQRVLCWKSLTWDAWSPGEAALFPLGALSQSKRPRGLCSPQQRCAQLQQPSRNSGGEQGGGESTTRALGHLHWNGDTAGMGGREGTGGDGAAVGVPGACCALRSR